MVFLIRWDKVSGTSSDIMWILKPFRVGDLFADCDNKHLNVKFGNLFVSR